MNAKAASVINLKDVRTAIRTEVNALRSSLPTLLKIEERARVKSSEAEAHTLSMNEYVKKIKLEDEYLSDLEII